MPLATDIADDLDYFDGVEAVSVQHRSLAGVTTATTTGVSALRRATTTAPAGAGSGAQSVMTQARWHLKASDLATAPKRGDRIVTGLTVGGSPGGLLLALAVFDSTAAGSETWEVDRVSLQTLGTRYAVETRKVAG